jgi:HD-like signal output (HDOD) protein
MDVNSTISVILSCISKRDDFPALSETIDVIGRLSSDDEPSVGDLAEVILRDFSLSSKVLRLVNSVIYRQTGEITTVSRAIMVLGHRNIRNIALGLSLFNHLSKDDGHQELRDLLVRAVYSGVLARRLASGANFVDTEEAFICSLFHTLGRIMVAFYLPDSYGRIESLMREQAADERSAVHSVLGTDMESIGQGIAAAWRFPQRIVSCMVRIGAEERGRRGTDLDSLRAISTLSNEVTDLLAASRDMPEKKKAIENLLASFGTSIGMAEIGAKDLIAGSLAEIEASLSAYGLSSRKSPFVRDLVKWSAGAPVHGAGQTETPARIPDVTAPPVSLVNLDDLSERLSERDPQTMLMKGIEEVSKALLTNFSINDIFRITVETIHQALRPAAASRTLLLIRDKGRPVMLYRFGLGDCLGEVRQWFSVPLERTSDVFNLSLVQQQDVVIKDTMAPDITALLPDWYQANSGRGTYLILLPIVIAGRPIGLICIEGEREGLGKLSGACFNYLKILRDQSVLAIRQKT